MTQTAQSMTREDVHAIDAFMLGVLFICALVARVVSAHFLPFPALDDPAFYLKVAENLAQGRGLVIDAIWNYQTVFPAIEHPSNEHWMPLPSLVMAPFFALFGSSYALGQTIGAFFGALIVPITWFTCERALPVLGRWRGATFFTCLLVSFNPLLVYQSVTVDSAVYFTVFCSLAILLASQSERSLALSGVVGVLIGLAYLSRTEGLILLGVALFWTWRHYEGAVRWRHGAAILAGALMLMAPWFARNALTFGTPFPSSTLILALIPDYPTLFHYGRPSFWEGLPPLDLGKLLMLRLEGIGHNVQVLLVQTLFPVIPLVLGGLGPLWRTPVTSLGLLVGAALFLVSALLFPVATIFGMFYHSVGAVTPVLTMLAVVGLLRFGRFIGERLFEDSQFMPLLLSAATFFLVLVQVALAMSTAAQVHLQWADDFAVAARVLKEENAAVVMTTQPNSLHYATNLPAVMLPVSDPLETALEVARKYGATHIVGFGSFGRYPEAIEQGANSGLKPVYASERVWVYKVP